MATFELAGPEGGTYRVEAPDESSALAAFSAFHNGTAAPLNKYQRAAKEDVDALEKAGVAQTGISRRLAHGVMLGADNTLVAAAMTPAEMIKRGTLDPSEGYNYAKARQDEELDRARKTTGALGTAAEVLGGGVAGGGLARGGISFARALAPEAGLIARTAASSGDAAAIGGFAGGMEGNGAEERIKNAIKGAGAGAIGGAVIPPVLSAAKGVISPVIANLHARINPESFAQSQVARAVHESGMTPQQLGQEIESANAGGAPYTLADALGNPGQRMLSTVARAPGQGRTDVVNFLENRQAGQADRVGQILDEALGGGETSQQAIARLTHRAQQESRPLYQAALGQRPVWNERIQQFFDDPITQRGLREGVAVQRLESLAEGRPFNPNDYAITNFNEAGDPIISGVPNMRTINLIKKGFDNILEGYRDGTTGRLNLDEYGRALDMVRRNFLREVDAVNPLYAQARRAYAGPAQVREAVGVGELAATRGRAADNLDRFNNLNEPSQQGFRTGYANKIVGDVERAAVGANKVRPLSSAKRQEELNALSLHQGPVQPGATTPLDQRLAREQRMFETRNQALGNSKTAENLADEAAMSVDPHLVGQILQGNWHGALRSALHAGSNVVTGNTPAVREAVGRMLLQQGANPASLDAMIGNTVRRIEFIQNLARNLGRGVAGGLSTQLTPQRRAS